MGVSAEGVAPAVDCPPRLRVRRYLRDDRQPRGGSASFRKGECSCPATNPAWATGLRPGIRARWAGGKARATTAAPGRDRGRHGGNGGLIRDGIANYRIFEREPVRTYRGHGLWRPRHPPAARIIRFSTSSRVGREELDLAHQTGSSAGRVPESLLRTASIWPTLRDGGPGLAHLEAYGADGAQIDMAARRYGRDPRRGDSTTHCCAPDEGNVLRPPTLHFVLGRV
jgi:hypothetical protein